MESLSVASSASDSDLISVTQSLAKEAYVLFQLGKYVDCLKVLNQILDKKADDPKVLHNIAIVENFQDGFSNPKRFLEVLDNLKKRSERPAHSTGENAEVLNSRIKSVGNKGNKGIAADEFDVSVTMFNIAVILYHLHEYEKCFSILERLYQNIEPIDERVARHVCLLLLDVSLVCHHASRAADVIGYMERVGGNNLVNQGDSGNISQQQLTNLVIKSTSAPNNVMLSSDPINSDQTVSTNGPESPLSRTPSEETLENLMMEINTRPSNDLSKIQTDESFISTPDLRMKVHLYKVWILILTRNLKAAKREVKMAMNVARGKDYSLALFLKSQLEYARNNHRKAIKLLMASVSQTETGTSALYYNNLGCIYYQLGKYETSAIFFSKALGTSSPQRKEKTMKLFSFSQDKSVLFAYNCGLLYLTSGKPVLAVRCFQQAGSVFFKRPLLWLRIAECCIMFSEKKADIDVKIVGRGKWRQLVVERWNLTNVVQVDPDLSLAFAKRCLLNALHLLDCPYENLNPQPNSNMVNSNGEAKETKVGNSSGNPNPLLQSSVNEYEALCGKENLMILQAVLADLAFVYLELGNAVKALAAAKCLLKLPECSRVYAFLGNVYAAEAYCLLNQPKLASEHLSSYISGQNSNNIELPYTQEDYNIWQSKKTVDLDEPNSNNAPTVDQSLPQGGSDSWFLKPEEARGVLLADMAAMAAAEGDMERAHEAVTLALSLLPNNPEVVLTATYVDLIRGNSQGAVLKLKQCSRVRFLDLSPGH
ncbi:putative tetratricopeptide-like helical domain superfamily [Helianthus annuus]|uniref:43kDa postsynaptic protein n=1 Tax=Helianthus annuus TaxID=4232 RepID=A0A251TQK0_HELAN|nr:CCR4-NOT transcription complex subunit 10 [Helianthus annuus]KAF5788286.1 putative 43kDa postsynaptic protein [Helianthus annuus]KAJ0515346.1 putative tetratricopeptide-like helical domain superfamily [Helianthus annuus]KAJ0523839.1 putative tetratricopeptide-like helical domain superfamily [Helianthus annuus]KAJ0531540.1 putative tetratricopeptide-like helical domain superfamily [Helianthus annuus]KAJ0698383.1 putative tetratricopeptide-like helical domain superfamily [Helianthus annuus]